MTLKADDIGNQIGVCALMNCDNSAGFRIAFRDAEGAGYLAGAQTIGALALGYARYMVHTLEQITEGETKWKS